MSSSEESGQPLSQRALSWGLGLFLVASAYFLWTEHRAHVIGALPWLLLLIGWPIMHRLMRRARGLRHEQHAPGSDDKEGATGKQHQHGGHGCC